MGLLPKVPLHWRDSDWQLPRLLFGAPLLLLQRAQQVRVQQILHSQKDWRLVRRERGEYYDQNYMICFAHNLYFLPEEISIYSTLFIIICYYSIMPCHALSLV